MNTTTNNTNTSSAKVVAMPVGCTPTKVGNILNPDGSIMCDFDRKSIQGYNDKKEEH